MRHVFLDIETLPPDEASLEKCGLPCEKDSEEFRKLALSGDYGRVLTIGLIVEVNGEIMQRGLLGRERQTSFFHLDEARTLRAFWKLMKGFHPKRDLIIGHNAFDFDLPFLYKRSIIQRVQPSVQISFARYRSQPIFDTMREWEKWGRNYVSLDKLAKILGLESSKQGGIDGSRVYDCFCAGGHTEIAAYCMRDVELVRAIFTRMTSPEETEPTSS
ncbi:MAG TPA: ribonuclease H-like domain-containing protein [Pyrinomonadaceae bacterium]|jgi:hypothetical protein|nr:ribonuclease H-like domain-containing protein [Pyrinomonadaceae bacterium]